ncbi:hypothetical protein NQ314_003258 [Rhamnusium bicolor]|uniref:N-acetyltransferase domain-containing protein n=1 Tax=Rhamnusium bicolor TaxID=1586634 RepID=A0AAV8ZQ73_9CUCU|nr:hypothetical protein NQ314_003258 [Rhamnusium bicolor]
MSCPSTPSTPTSPIDYEIQIITIEDKEEVQNFLQTFFYRDEPLNSYLQVISEETPRCIDLEIFSLKNLENGLNLKVIHNGKLIGVCLNGILERGWVEKEEPFKCEDKKFNYIRFPGCDKAITVKILSVDGAYRGKGIAKELVAKTRYNFS